MYECADACQVVIINVVRVGVSEYIYMNESKWHMQGISLSLSLSIEKDIIYTNNNNKSNDKIEVDII